MKNRYEKKNIYVRTLISLLIFYLITMMIFTVIYEQIVVSRTAFVNTNKLSNAVYMAQKSMFEYEADPSLVNRYAISKICNSIASSMGEPLLYGACAIFDENKDLISKSGEYLVINEHIQTEYGDWTTQAFGICLDDYMKPDEINELEQYWQYSPHSLDEKVKTGDLVKEYKITADIYIKDNEIVPKKIIVTEEEYEINDITYTSLEDGSGSIASSSRKLNEQLEKEYIFHPENIDDFELRNFIDCSLENSYTVKNGLDYLPLSDSENLKKSSLAKAAADPSVLNPINLKDRYVYNYAEGFLQVKVTDICYFKDREIMDGKGFYFVVEGVFNPWLYTFKSLVLVYLSSFLLLLFTWIFLSRKLWEIYKRQEALEVNRRRFTDAIAHDLKTPVALISAYTEALKENINFKKDEYLDVIAGEVQRMDHMIMEMLTLSKLESGVQSLHLEKIKMNDLIKQESLKYNRMLMEREILLHIEENDLFILTCDSVQMTKVLHNLFSNSLRYCIKGGEITVRIEKSGFQIEDTGEPIPEEKMDHIWEPFYKAEESRKRDESEAENIEGTGLGLAIVKQILDMHHLQYGIMNTQTGVSFWISEERR
ncbi:HAMP domain-containing sensor histidine kinase [Sinanaerobacter sp. ZZT-01]|uniref:sensor histidine kinase n=1 Tax=Sinanaerobacter sp. ZZT-01 TaxID=3111540 RepID=UPI002D7756B6|nr:HAMP domain-containing sensor histidine kinase [Sinanaerobacter sp. ZZT-01]WRR93183.1 HAMP domain-containing sensor histidine kinase [Sinanaerobacter sp. ZZT-01]